MTLAQEANKLAQMAQSGDASAASIERLAVLTRRVCFMRCVAFARVSLVRWDDVDDATQLAAIKCMGRLGKWDGGAASWSTFCGMVTSTVIKDQKREHARQSEKRRRLAEMETNAIKEGD